MHNGCRTMHGGGDAMTATIESTDAGAPIALSPIVQAVAEETIATRRFLHQHAEPSWEEGWTAAAVEERLRSFGFDDVHTYAATGRTAFLKGGKPGPTVLYRADIDGLPLREETGVPFASSAEAGMHACGH